MPITNSLTRPENGQENKTPLLLNQLVLLFLFAAIEAVFIFPQHSKFLGPVIVVLLMYTYYAMHETILATVIVIIANDALQTMFFGKMSFHYLLLAFIFTEILRSQKIQVRSLLLVAVATLMCGQLVVVGDITFHMAVSTFLFTTALSVQYSKYKDNTPEFFEKMWQALAISVTLIAIHAVVTGGVEYYELNWYSEEILRRGILGVGVGDSNFSCLSLCTGIIAALNCKGFPRLVKTAMVFLMVWAQTITLSITGLLALLMILIFHFSANKKVLKTIAIAVAVILLLIMLYNVYLALPENLHAEMVDAYVNRVTEKIDEFRRGEVIAATSNRSRIMVTYMRYVLGQSGLKLLFGGNGVMLTGGVPHNTYIDWALQFGLIGALAIIWYIVRRFVLTCKSTDLGEFKKTIIIFKCLYLLFAFTLSIYSGAIYSTMFFFLFCL